MVECLRAGITAGLWYPAWLMLGLLLFCAPGLPAAPALDWIRVGPDAVSFVRGDPGTKFVVWGFNYDHDADGRLLEDYWSDEWATT